MCGIAGVWQRDGGHVPVSLLDAMTEALAHRGPDETSTWLQGPVGLGHTRLSIIDLAHSAQPMHSASGLHLVFNGEIFNYRDLRARTPYPYTTRGDTETLLAVLDTKGVAGVPDLTGQFAFAVYDEHRRELSLVRDRLGVLPLYYLELGNTFAFASEIKSLLPLLGGQPELDQASLAQYFSARAVHAPYTLLQGVRKLRPGHVLTITARGPAAEHRYWSVPATQQAWTDSDAVAALDQALQHAVDLALVADVPVGAYLSGGLDSSLLVGLVSARPTRPSTLHTFAAGFVGADGNADELPFARTMSEHLGTTHHEVLLRHDQFQEEWARLSWYRDAPLSEPADVAVAALARTAAQHVKVVLSGEGADELFAGYPKHRMDAWAARLSDLPLGLRRAAVAGIEQRLPASGRRLRVLLRVLTAADEAERFTTWFAPYTAGEVRSALPSAAVELDRRRAGKYEELTAGQPTRLARMLAHDLATWLPDNLLERGDRMTMASSVELRPPFLDHAVVELAFSLPDRYKVREGTGKWLVKQVAKKYVPAEIIDRRKAGFPVPLASWFRAGSRELLWDLLTAQESVATQVFGQAAIRDLLSRHDAGRSDEAAKLWTLLSLEVWHESFRGGASLAA